MKKVCLANVQSRGNLSFGFKEKNTLLLKEEIDFNQWRVRIKKITRNCEAYTLPKLEERDKDCECLYISLIQINESDILLENLKIFTVSTRE